jgi:four helix bundle protein
MKPENPKPDRDQQPGDPAQASHRQPPSRTYDLEDRLLAFAAGVIHVSEKLPNSRAGNHVAGQFLRSGTSPYGNHGEAQEPESMDDFIHKMKICLKELRETRRWARLIDHERWLAGDTKLTLLSGESDELIRIFKASIRTAERNRGGPRQTSSSRAGERLANAP